MTRINSTLAFAVTICAASAAAAQDLDVDISSDGISIGREQWYENPIVWVGFGLLLLVLLFIGLRRGKSA